MTSKALDARGRGLVAVTLALATGAVLAAAAGVGSRATPRRARDFALTDVNPASPTHGQTLALHELYAERGLVLQFVASWCTPCRDELPALQRLYVEGRLPLALVAADEYGSTENLLIVAERSGLSAPILFAPEARAEELARAYRHEMLPATYLVDRRGRIREVHEGARPVEALLRSVERELS